ncbi:Isochorismatase hydrolase [Lophiostoma macrostomum CBS 122681]|uniref:Isochorismatase hydrolase n=1 Tax=Lophiostoma macrostomum CBS 122681 TaxID=1314788 RepID=A0A6A6TC08_9PLEO|nr:Isochorismatase hydrolase [Lophiostoma macrostomum CBS 122681]
MTTPFDSSNAGAPGHYAPSQTALLLCDFHSFLTNRIGGSDTPVVNTAASLRNWALSHGIVVIHNLIDKSSTPSLTAKDAGRLRSAIANLTAEGNAEPSKLTEPKPAGEGKELTFTRQIGHVSALKSPGMLESLEERGIKSLLVTGISTSGCVLRTAMAGCDADFVITVVEDGCADPTEGAHEFVVKKLLPNRGWVCTAKEVMNGFESVKSGR